MHLWAQKLWNIFPLLFPSVSLKGIALKPVKLPAISQHPHTKPMSQMIAVNTSLLSPISPSDAWDQQRSPYSADTIDAIGWSYYTLPPSPPTSVSSHTTDSPIPTARMLASRYTPDSLSEGEPQHCLPTHQLFDLPEDENEASDSSSASPPPSIPPQLSLSIDTGVPAVKRSFPSTTGGAKKPRGSGERITTKDFIPPDVSGLSKREARLVKNRAAAFLSRQRKREEFEAMEIHVKELEEENLRLQTMAEKGSSYDELRLEVEQLRLRLSAAEKRERELTVELARGSAPNTPVKTEAHDHSLPPAPYAQSALTSQNSAATLGLMKQVLLCALPSLLSLPSQSPLPVSVSVPLPSSIAAGTSTTPFGHASTSTSIGEQDRPQYPHSSAGFSFNSADLEPSRKLSAVGTESSSDGLRVDSETLRALGGFDISFDALPTEESRFRVRVHSSERSNNVTVFPTIRANRPRSSSLASWAGPDAASFALQSFASAPQPVPFHTPSPSNVDHLSPFMETGSSHSKLGFDASMMQSTHSPFGHHVPDQAFEYYSGYLDQITEDTIKHRVRSAWKGIPQVSNEAEWEIPVC
ncbi:hypothetical protein HYDPIDRAFT_110042 [Hydnomerulius pinastri MD-312]|nr:hypothetical protein HYDPIDRAFT_110042 [Hydnomerulius pinastri MD-312]